MAFREVRDGLYLSDRAVIGPGALVGRNVRIWANVYIGAGAIIFDNVEIGCPGPREMDEAMLSSKSDIGGLDLLDEAIKVSTTIGPGAKIRAGVQIYAGCEIGRAFDCAHFVNIRENVRLGDEVYAKVHTEVRREVVVGKACTIGGLLGDRAVVNDGATSFGVLVHEYKEGRRGLVEPAPILGAGCFVGRNASLIGGIHIGDRAFVAAGTTVACDVPSGALVIGPKPTILLDRSPLI